jgi:hypothetical protein
MLCISIFKTLRHYFKISATPVLFFGKASTSIYKQTIPFGKVFPVTLFSKRRNVVILTLKELTPQMRAMEEQLLCLTVLIGSRATHGMGVMDSLFAQTARSVI